MICHFAKKLSIMNNDFFKIFSTSMKWNNVSKTLFTWIIIEFDLQSSWKSFIDNDQFFKTKCNELHKVLRKIIIKF